MSIPIVIMQTLKNDILSIAVDNHGAELTSINKNGVEYLWQADPAFWKRHSPVLFPIVGIVYNKDILRPHLFIRK